VTRNGYLPFRLLAFLLASLSVCSLLLYFFGIGRFGLIAPLLLAIETAGLLGLALAARTRGRRDLTGLLAAGLWAGCIATLAYDLVRVPLVHSRMPVFKAISYFGTLLLGIESESVASAALGWGYHLTNGVSFGLMYAALVRRPGAVTAVLWGIALEGVMLLTPYAEVFGYARDSRFVAVTLGSHAVYGLVLWLALKWYAALCERWPRGSLVAGFIGVPVALALLAADFHAIHGRSLPASPPPYIGPHLYTTWNTPEPDRLALLWLLKRRVDPAAEFHFIEPFEKIRFGRPLDLPEADVRRKGRQSATEVLVSRFGIRQDPRTALLVRTTHLAEVSKWMLIGDSEATREVDALRAIAARHCGEKLTTACLSPIFGELDRRYGERPE